MQTDSFFQAQYLVESPETRIKTTATLMPDQFKDFNNNSVDPYYSTTQKRTVKLVKHITPAKKTSRRSLSSLEYDSSETNDPRRKSIDSDLINQTTYESRKYLVPSQIKAKNRTQLDKSLQLGSGLSKYLSEQLRNLSDNQPSPSSPPPPPFILFKQTLPPFMRASPGEPMIFKFELNNPDAQVIWYKDNVKLFNTPATQTFSDFGRHMLVLPKVFSEDSGLFRAVVMTPMGTSETSCRLFVEGVFFTSFIF